MKKILLLLLAVMTALSMCGLASADSALPAVGEVSHGFEVRETRRFEMIGADVILYEHLKTGAQVMYIANDDLNRVFDIVFRTPTLDNRGIPHVFEHSTLDGSRKYPSKTLSMNLSYQTYNTYMNASTYNFMTTYPIASLSEDQLLLYADYYSDCCFNPIVYDDESIFREEAWRYAMSSPEDDLTIAGTVYTEMKGAYTLASAASFNFKGTIFPGAYCANVHGGIPTQIPEMNWDDLKAYHTAYYHPSNSLTYLYGKFENVDAFLELLDAYFSPYDRLEFTWDDPDYTPITSPVSAGYDYGYAAGANTADSTVAYYGFVCRDATPAELDQLDMLTTLLSADFSPFAQRMKDELPSASAACYIGTDGPEYYIYFIADGIDPEETDTFKRIVDDSIADAVRDGFRLEDAEAIISSYKLSILLATESTSVGVDTIPNMAYYWATTGNLWGYMDYIDSLDNFTAYVADGTLTALAQKYLAGSELTAIAVTTPVAGLKDAEDAALAEKLAGIKAGMSEEEIAAIVAATNAVEQSEDNTEAVRALTAVTVDSLPEDVRIFDITDSTSPEGLRLIDVDANTAGVGQAAVLLDAQGIPQDMLHYFKLYVDAIGELPTASHTRQELSTLITRDLYSGVIRVSAMDEGDDCHPYLRAGFIALDEDMQAGYDLLYELLFETDFSDAQAIANIVSSLKNSVKATINGSVYNIILYRAYAVTQATSAYFSYVSYLDYYDFLCETEKQLESDPGAVIAGLQAIQKYFNNSVNAISGFVGNAASRENHRAAADSFFARLDKQEIVPQTYDFPVMANPEALIIDGAVQFNMIFADYASLGMEEYSGGLDAVTALVTDTFLYPMLRDQYGVYGALHGAAETGVYLISYRDPNITETFEVYAKLSDLVAAMTDLDQETLDGYILSSYSAYALSNGELTDGFSALLNYIGGKAQDEKVAYMRQLKAVTPEAFLSYGEMYKLICEKGLYVTAGSAAAINANSDLYANILNPFGVVDTSNADFDDLTGDEWYYDAARFCLKNAYAYPAGDTHFGAMDQATLGDLAVGMYIAIGGNYSPEDAVAYLSQFGIVPAADVNTPLTREDMAVCLYNFFEAMGIQVADMPMDGFTDTDQVSAGCEGMIGCMLAYEMVLPAADGVFAPQESATMADICWAFYVLMSE